MYKDPTLLNFKIAIRKSYRTQQKDGNGLYTAALHFLIITAFKTCRRAISNLQVQPQTQLSVKCGFKTDIVNIFKFKIKFIPMYSKKLL